jgi:hypothetical protein
MDQVRNAIGMTYVKINIFISSSSQITQNFKDIIATLNKVAESAGNVSNQKR